MKLRITTYGRAAFHHSESQDRFAVHRLEDGGALCVLSDGVGSSRDPGRCADRVARLVADNYVARPRQWGARRAFQLLAEQINRSLYEEGVYWDGTPSMQATLAAVSLEHNRLNGMTVGDSLILMVRKGLVERLSRSDRRVTADGCEMLTQAVGMGPGIEPHHFERALLPGDRIVLVSDGLFHLYHDEDGSGALGHAAAECVSARNMVDKALQQGIEPQDDVSAVMVDIEQLGPDQPSLQPEGAPGVPAHGPAAVPRPVRGRDFDGFRLLRPIGGNDRVWLAEKEGKKFVLKFVPEEAETDDTGLVLSRFAREAWNACNLKGSWFVPASMAAAPTDGSCSYYVMEHIEAPSLSFLLKSRRLSADEVATLGVFLCRALQFLLGRELVHGDVKPDNLLVYQESGTLSFKLLDLGLATPVFTPAGRAGTASYLAPERFGEETSATVTERTEIFSIGATLYEALTGRPPFGRIERFQKPHLGAVIRPSRANPNVPAWLDAVILKCLSRDGEKRFQNYSELLFALEHPEKSAQEAASLPLLERNPLLFYKIAFWVLLVCNALLFFAWRHK